MTSEGEMKFWGEFGPRKDAMLRRLQKAAGVGKPKPMNLGDLEVIAAASMELLTTAWPKCPSQGAANCWGVIQDHGGRCCLKARLA